jgi:hypothetical protein
MKQCPECKREYDDDSLRFCLDDGTALVRPDASPKSADPTVVLPGKELAPTQIAEPARPDVPLPARVRANKEIIPAHFHPEPFELSSPSCLLLASLGQSLVGLPGDISRFAGRL